MALTYEQHLAAVLAAHPTPTILWHLHRDNPDHAHDDSAIAFAETSFNGYPFEFEAHAQGAGSDIVWSARWLRQGEGKAREQWTRNDQDWATMKREAQEALQGYCQPRQALMARNALALDLLTDEGLLYYEIRPVELTGLHVGSSPQLFIPIAPVFSPDTLAYTATTPISPLTLTATAPEGSEITWAMAGAGTTGPSLMVSIVEGANVVTVTVAAPGHLPTTYTLTITKP